MVTITKSPVPVDTDTYKQIENYWEHSWSDSGFTPCWLVSSIPPELYEAVDSQWFSADKAILDVGCGSGEHSAWLAERNFNVLGIDISASAIERAKQQYGEIPGQLAFQVADVCCDRPAIPEMDALLDRACLHGLPKVMYKPYAETMAAWARPGAHFLLLYGLHRGEKLSEEATEALRQKWQTQLKSLFEPFFNFEKIEYTHIERREPFEPLPGLAFWMIRKK